jgi:hypothetical protein
LKPKNRIIAINALGSRTPLLAELNRLSPTTATWQASKLFCAHYPTKLW